MQTKGGTLAASCRQNWRIQEQNQMRLFDCLYLPIRGRSEFLAII